MRTPPYRFSTKIGILGDIPNFVASLLKNCVSSDKVS
jgi:hypothetical protein